MVATKEVLVLVAELEMELNKGWRKGKLPMSAETKKKNIGST